MESFTASAEAQHQIASNAGAGILQEGWCQLCNLQVCFSPSLFPSNSLISFTYAFTFLYSLELDDILNEEHEMLKSDRQELSSVKEVLFNITDSSSEDGGEAARLNNRKSSK